MNIERFPNTSYGWDFILFWIIIHQKRKITAVFKTVKRQFFTVSTVKPFLNIMLLTEMDFHCCVYKLFWWELSDLDPVCKLISADCFEFERNLIWKLPCSTPCGSGGFFTSSVKQCIVSIWLFLFYLNCFLLRRRNSLQTRQTSADLLLQAKPLKRYLSCD